MHHLSYAVPFDGVVHLLSRAEVHDKEINTTGHSTKQDRVEKVHRKISVTLPKILE